MTDRHTAQHMIAAVSFLNTRPLVHGLEGREHGVPVHPEDASEPPGAGEPGAGAQAPQQ